MGDPYTQYYYRQATGAGLSTFRGVNVQRGSGLGGLLNAAFRTFAPSLKHVGKAALKQGALAGAHILGDVLGGRSLGSSAKSRLIAGGKRFFNETLTTPTGPAAKKAKQSIKRRRVGVPRRVGGKMRRRRRAKKRGARRRRPQLGGGRGTVKVGRKRKGAKSKCRSVLRRFKKSPRDIFSA